MAAPRTIETDALLGTLVGGRFLVQSRIARGGMGSVYQAVQQPLGRTVALKVLDPRYEGQLEPRFEERFLLEASTLARLCHPNTVSVFDFGRTDQGLFFIAMEHVHGESLLQRLRTCTRLSHDQAMHIALQIARSLREAHSLGIVHRDLKPGNILLSDHGDASDHVKVVDFGLAKDVRDQEQELTDVDLFLGSPAYVAPEQIRDDAVDARTDIYALGVLLYQMLAGRLPFRATSAVEMMMAHVHEAVPSLRREGVPEPLDGLVLQCLRKNPDERYASMDELITALKSVAQALGSPLLTSGEHALSISSDSWKLPPDCPSSEVRTPPSVSQVSSCAPGSHPPGSHRSSSPPGQLRVPAGVADSDSITGPLLSGSASARSSSGVPMVPSVEVDMPIGAARRRLRWLFAAGLCIAALGATAWQLRPDAESAKQGTAPTQEELARVGSGSENVSDAQPRVTKPASADLPQAAPTAEVTSAVASSDPGENELNQPSLDAKEPDTPAAGIVTTTLHLKSRPQGASIFINGKRQVSSTPAMIDVQGTSGEDIRIAFRRRGYRPVYLRQEVPDAGLDAPVQVKVRLKPVHGRSSGPPRTAAPPKAKRAVDMKSFKTTPY